MENNVKMTIQYMVQALDTCRKDKFKIWQNAHKRYREYLYSVVVYQQYLTRLGELIIFEPWRENYLFSQPS